MQQTDFAASSGVLFVIYSEMRPLVIYVNEFDCYSKLEAHNSPLCLSGFWVAHRHNLRYHTDIKIVILTDCDTCSHLSYVRRLYFLLRTIGGQQEDSVQPGRGSGTKSRRLWHTHSYLFLLFWRPDFSTEGLTLRTGFLADDITYQN